MDNRRILCVDDDLKILNGIQRQQGLNFDITLAVGPEAALACVRTQPPFAVVLSDMRMPGMSGVELLSQIRDLSPATVRMILTGFSELQSTIEAVNRGHIFRFLAKPCESEGLATALEAGLRQYALIEAERELLENTLHGSIKLLVEVLALAHPLAFIQPLRVRETVSGILKRFSVDSPWQVEIASMLSALGCMILPEHLLARKRDRLRLSSEETTTYEGHAAFTSELIRSIPRLEPVAEMIAAQHGKAEPLKSPTTSQILRLAIEFDQQEQWLGNSKLALAELLKHPESYDSELLEALTQHVKSKPPTQLQSLMPDEIEEGMILAEDVTLHNGRSMMPQGMTITRPARQILANAAFDNSTVAPIQVSVSCSASPANVSHA